MRVKAFVFLGSASLIAGFFLAGFLPPVSAQTAVSSTKDGVYTDDQAQKGKDVYTKQCAMCHGETLQGVGTTAPLAGDAFLKKWAGRSMSDLFSKTITTMPAMSPGSLKPDQTAQVLAYVLSQNKFQAGKKDLPADSQALIVIQIDKP